MNVARAERRRAARKARKAQGPGLNVRDVVEVDAKRNPDLHAAVNGNRAQRRAHGFRGPRVEVLRTANEDVEEMAA